MTKRRRLGQARGPMILAASVWFSALFLSPPLQASGREPGDIYPDYREFMRAERGETVTVGWGNRSSAPGGKTFPTLGGAPQCPYETLRRGLQVPMLGNMDLRLFCVPRGTDKTSEAGVTQNP
jgi:hypothetical protein